jgi:hypothetical protein
MYGERGGKEGEDRPMRNNKKKIKGGGPSYGKQQ